ncbi:MAG: PspC domain-containing protein [bacterium]|nr:PspC domain-containing protein [bacterium]
METTHTTPIAESTRLTRPTEGRVLGGVAAAVANHTGSSVGIVRLGFLVAALFGGFGIILYLAAWALMPGEGEGESAAERWLRNLTTPGKRLGAFFVGLAGLVVLAGAAPATIFAAVALLAAAALLANSRESTSQAIPAAPLVEEKE